MVIFFGSHHSYDIPAPFLFPKCKCTLLIDQLRIPRQVCVGQHMICDAGWHGRSLLLRRFLSYFILENILSLSAVAAEIAFNFDRICMTPSHQDQLENWLLHMLSSLLNALGALFSTRSRFAFAIENIPEIEQRVEFYLF